MSSENELEQLYATHIQELKDKTISKLKNHDWMEQMRLKCRAYIRNNGTKIISVEEISNYLAHDAIKSFPQHLKSELADELKNLYNELYSLMEPDVITADTFEEQ